MNFLHSKLEINYEISSAIKDFATIYADDASDNQNSNERESNESPDTGLHRLPPSGAQRQDYSFNPGGFSNSFNAPDYGLNQAGTRNFYNTPPPPVASRQNYSPNREGTTYPYNTQQSTGTSYQDSTLNRGGTYAPTSNQHTWGDGAR